VGSELVGMLDSTGVGFELVGMADGVAVGTELVGAADGVAVGSEVAGSEVVGALVEMAVGGTDGVAATVGGGVTTTFA